MHRHIPNILTLMRIGLALTGAAAIWLSYHGAISHEVPAWLGDPVRAVRALAIFGVIAFIIAAATDWLDGYLARRWDARSQLGAWIDPIADKLLVDGYLIVYMVILSAPLTVAVPVVALVLRDVAVTAARFLPRAASDTPALAVSPAAKLKTALAMLIAGFPLIAVPLGWQENDLILTGWIAALWLTTALSLATAIDYFRK